MIKLGDKVKDKVSGISGIVVSRIEFLNGCIQFGVQPPYDKKDQREISNWNIDEAQLDKIPGGLNAGEKKVPIGGATTRSVARSKY